MGNVLLITSSPRGEHSLSSRVATELARSLGGDLNVRELWRDPLPSIDPIHVQAMFTPEEHRTAEQRSILSRSDEAAAELFWADTIVIAAGMINFSAPATLKTWIDHVVRAGITFRYGEAGPVGLVAGKRAILILASGGVYSYEPMKAFDHLEPVLRSQLSFIGITDIEVIRIEGTMQGEEALERALATARERSEAMARANRVAVVA